MPKKIDQRSLRRRLPHRLPAFQWALGAEPKLPEFLIPSPAFDKSWSDNSLIPIVLRNAFQEHSRAVTEAIDVLEPFDRQAISRLFVEIRRACSLQVVVAVKTLEMELEFPVAVHFEIKDSFTDLQGEVQAARSGIGEPEAVQEILREHFGINSRMAERNRIDGIAFQATVATMYMRCHRLATLWEAWHFSKIEAALLNSTESLSEGERDVACALRGFGDELMHRFRSSASIDPTDVGVRWHRTDTSSPLIRSLPMALAVDTENGRLEDHLISTYVVNLLSRCHLGLKAAKENEFITTAAFSVLGVNDESSAIGRRGVVRPGLELMSAIVSGVDQELLGNLANRIQVSFIRSYVRKLMIEDPRSHYPRLLESAILGGTSSIEPRAKRIYAGLRWFSELLGEADDPGPLPLDLADDVEVILDALRSAQEDGESDVLQSLIHECLPSAMYGDMLLLLGIPEVDNVIPSLLPIRVGRRAEKQIKSAWKSWAALLHDDELEDHSSLVTNMNKALERQLADVVFLPFEQAARSLGWFDPDDKDAKKSEVMKRLHKRITEDDDSTIELGAAAFILKPFRDAPPSFKANDGVLRKQWRTFVMSRGDRLSPSMIWDLEIYAKNYRNLSSHDAPIFSRDQAIEARGRAWLLLRNLGTDDANNRQNLLTSDRCREIGMPEDEIEMYEIWRGKRR